MIYPSLLDFFGISPSSPYHFTHTELFSELNILFLGVRSASKKIIVNMGFGLSNNLFRLQCRMCHVSLLTSKVIVAVERSTVTASRRLAFEFATLFEYSLPSLIDDQLPSDQLLFAELGWKLQHRRLNFWLRWRNSSRSIFEQLLP